MHLCAHRKRNHVHHNRINFAADELPTLDKLQILKYTMNGRRNKLQIINYVCHKWKDIACLICDDANILSVLEQRYHGDPTECLQQVFIDYFINRKPLNYSQDWNGLIELLKDIGFVVVAEEVRCALTLESGDQHDKVSIHYYG